ncbi:MAG TPA: radical SAM protein [Elusimicrobiota bacterium]|nr:radical SAM protein [Elusimicrobiota bacterium]
MEKAAQNRHPQVRFTWNIHWSCNYRCSYCFFETHWEEYGKRNVYKSVDEWMGYWERAAELYGRCFITINGGEPFTYPGFVDLIARLSRVHWPINITTNTSLHLKEFVKKVDPERVSLSVSYHPEYHRVDDFLEKVFFLRQSGFVGGCVNFVAHPNHIGTLPALLEKFVGIGESLKVNPFIGEHAGRRYPDGYTPEQKEILGMRDSWMDDKRHKGMLCRAGNLSGLLLPNGNVARCGQIGDRHIVGSFFDPKFRLLPEPLPCDVEFCPCDEWKVVPDEKEPENAGAWLP